MQDDNEMLTISEAARLMGVCENTLRAWDENGSFTAFRTAGDHRRYSLGSIREYLDKNKISGDLLVNPILPPKKEKLKFEEELVLNEKKWRDLGYLPEENSDFDNKNLAILLRNCENYCTDSAGLDSNNYLWLTQQAWLRSKLRKYISIQAAWAPASLVFYVDNGKINSDAVSAKMNNYSLKIFTDVNFDSMKEIYADCLAKEIDLEISCKLREHHPIKLEDILDCSMVHCVYLNNLYDYIISDKKLLDLVKNNKNIIKDGVELIEMPVSIDSNFEVMSVGGKKILEKENFNLPIFAPYVLLLPIVHGQYITCTNRTSWFDPKKNIFVKWGKPPEFVKPLELQQQCIK